MGVDVISTVWPQNVAAHVQVFTFIDLGFSYMGRHFALRRLSCIATASVSRGLSEGLSWCLLPSRSLYGVEPLTPLLHHADICQLRSLLAGHEFTVDRLDDQGVRTAASQLIHRGALGLFERIDVTSLRSTASPPARQTAAAQLPVSSPSSYARKPTETTTALRRSPSAKASTTPASIERQPDLIQALDQDAQAATLVVAARSGTPFCEECARHGAARAERVAV